MDHHPPSDDWAIKLCSLTLLLKHAKRRSKWSSTFALTCSLSYQGAPEAHGHVIKSTTRSGFYPGLLQLIQFKMGTRNYAGKDYIENITPEVVIGL